MKACLVPRPLRRWWPLLKLVPPCLIVYAAWLLTRPSIGDRG